MSPKQNTSVQAARERLRQAIEWACIARGEAQWTNGYRAGRYAGRNEDAEHERLYLKEMQQCTFCARAERARAESAIRAYARAIRAERQK